MPAVNLIIKMQIISAAAEKATKPNSMSMPGFCNVSTHVYCLKSFIKLHVLTMNKVKNNNDEHKESSWLPWPGPNKSFHRETRNLQSF